MRAVFYASELCNRPFVLMLIIIIIIGEAATAAAEAEAWASRAGARSIAGRPRFRPLNLFEIACSCILHLQSRSAPQSQTLCASAQAKAGSQLILKKEKKSCTTE
jgi:hypothetical protein